MTTALVVITLVISSKSAMAESVDDSPFNDEPSISDPVAVAADPIARADSDNDDTMSYFAKLAAEA